MKDFRNNISRHSNFDDHRHWEFARNTRIPHGSFDKRVKVDKIVFVVLMVLLALGLLAANLGAAK